MGDLPKEIERIIKQGYRDGFMAGVYALEMFHRHADPKTGYAECIRHWERTLYEWMLDARADYKVKPPPCWRNLIPSA